MHYLDIRWIQVPYMNLTPVSSDRAQVLLLFYKPTAADPLLNKIVAHFNPPFCHVELAFPERYGEEPWECDTYGSSIFQNETVFFKKKTYLRDGYVCLSIEVSHAQQWRIKTYCKLQAEAAVPFNQWAMYGSYLPFLRSEHGTFCSKHITNALLSGGIIDRSMVDPCTMTPSGLYNYLNEKIIAIPIVHVVPARMRASTAASGAQQTMKSIIANKQEKIAVEPPDANMRDILIHGSRKTDRHLDLGTFMSQAMAHTLVSAPSRIGTELPAEYR